MGTKPTDIADVLDNLVRADQTPGCNIWLCQVTQELARARAEIISLRARVAEPGLFEEAK